MKKALLGLLVTCSIFANEDTEGVFTGIYNHSGWGKNEEGIGFSGAGSTLANTRGYIAFIQDFIKTNNIHSVVDAGCGDWTFSKMIQWGDVEYLGVDVVKSVIDENVLKYSTDKIHFRHINMLQYELPVADLLICKDVLMHLSNRDIFFFLKAIKKFKHCLFTNNIQGVQLNFDIARGEYRPLDLTAYPFFFNGIKIFTYSTDHGPKEVLYHGN